MTLDRQSALSKHLANAEQVFRLRNPRSAAELQAAAEYMPGGNTRSVLFYEPFPLVMASGEGSHLTDVDGHNYVDLLGEYTAGIFGHSDPVIREAIYSAVAQGLNLAAHNTFEPRLAKILCERFPGIKQVRFTNSGSEATLMAVAASKCFTKRAKVLAFEGAYHGGFINFGAGASPVNVPHDFVLAPYNDLEAVSGVFQAHGAHIAAVIVEPMLGASGCIPASRQFLQLLRDESSKHACMLIFDEVMTSRLSPGGLQQQLGIYPDLTTLGKYLGGGSSFGAFGGGADVMAQFDPRRPDALAHAGTFNNNIISMAAGIAGLTKVYTPLAAESLNRRGGALRERLNVLFRDSQAPLQCTGAGSLMNFHATRAVLERPPAMTARERAIKKLLFFHLVEHGFYIAPRGFVTISLPVSDSELDGFAAQIAQFIQRYADVWDRQD